MSAAWGVCVRALQEGEGEGDEGILEMTGRTASLGVGLTQAGWDSQVRESERPAYCGITTHAIYR